LVLAREVLMWAIQAAAAATAVIFFILNLAI